MHSTQKEIDINNVSIITSGIIAKEGIWEKPEINDHVKLAYNIYSEIKNQYPKWYANQPCQPENMYDDGKEN
jgi:hypothetical protein